MKNLFYLSLLLTVVVLNLDAQILQFGHSKDKKFNPVNQKIVSVNKDQEQIAFDSLIVTNNLGNYMMQKELFKYNNYGQLIRRDYYYFDVEENSVDTFHYCMKYIYNENQKVSEIKYFENEILIQKTTFTYNTNKPQIVEFNEYYSYDPDTIFTDKKEFYLTGEQLDTLKYYDGYDELQNYDVYFYGQWQMPDSVYYYMKEYKGFVLSAKDIFQYNASGLRTLYANYYNDEQNIVPNFKVETTINANNEIIKVSFYNWQNNQWFLTNYEDYTYDNNKVTIIYSYYDYDSQNYVLSQKTESFYNQNNDVELMIFYEYINNEWRNNDKYEVTYKPYLVEDIFVPEDYFETNYVIDRLFAYSWQTSVWTNVLTYDVYCSPYVPSNLTKKSNLTMVLYPNPSSRYISIDVPSNVLIKIYDIKGRLVKEQRYNGLSINIDDLSAGSYILKAQTPEGFKTQMFIKK